MEPAMYHAIEFTSDHMVDLEVSPRKPLERLVIRKSDRRLAQLKPYVVETADGPVEVADLFFEDGTATRQIPFSSFRFVEGT
jgi:hypothetical protein